MDLDRGQLKCIIDEHLLPRQHDNPFAAHPAGSGAEFGATHMQLILQVQKITGVSIDKMPYLLGLTHLLWTGAPPHISDIVMPTTLTSFLQLATSLDDSKWLRQTITLLSSYTMMFDESQRLHRPNSLLMLTVLGRKFIESGCVVFLARSRLVDLGHLVSSNTKDTAEQIGMYFKRANSNDGLPYYLNRGSCNDHCSTAMATVSAVEKIIRDDSGDQTITLAKMGESLHQMHLELQAFVYTMSPKTEWSEFSVSTFLEKIAWAFHHDWTTASAFIEKEVAAEREQFLKLISAAVCTEFDDHRYIGAESSCAEVQMWLQDKGFDGANLKGMDGAQLLNISSNDLQRLTPSQGDAIYSGIHGMLGVGAVCASLWSCSSLHSFSGLPHRQVCASWSCKCP